MKIKFTNGSGDESEINIKGKCKITDYDTRTKSPDGKDLTINIDGENTSIMNGTELQQDSQTVEMNANKYSVFTALAAMDGDGSTLTQKDIANAKKNFNSKNAAWSVLENLGVTQIKYDSRAGVATIVIGENEILRIDFQTWKERLRLHSDSSKEVYESDIAEEPIEYKPYETYMDSIAQCESSNIKTKLNKSGYAGLFQIGEQALADLGIYQKKSKKYNNDWKGTFKKNKYGINSLSDFLNSADKQKKVFEDLMKKNWSYIQSYGLDKYIGKTINGQKITESGLLAGAHLVGINGLKKYLESEGQKDVKDGNGVSVSVYIERFAEYDMSNITGTPMGTLPPEIIYENIDYTVVSGDNLHNIAKRFNTTADRIKEASNLTSTNLKIGQKLVVPQGKIVAV